MKIKPCKKVESVQRACRGDLWKIKKKKRTDRTQHDDLSHDRRSSRLGRFAGTNVFKTDVAVRPQSSNQVLRRVAVVVVLARRRNFTSPVVSEDNARVRGTSRPSNRETDKIFIDAKTFKTSKSINHNDITRVMRTNSYSFFYLLESPIVVC